MKKQYLLIVKLKGEPKAYKTKYTSKLALNHDLKNVKGNPDVSSYSIVELYWSGTLGKFVTIPE